MNTRYCTNCLLHHRPPAVLAISLLAAVVFAASPSFKPPSSPSPSPLWTSRQPLWLPEFPRPYPSVSASGLPRDLTNSFLAARKRGQTWSVAPCRPTHLSNKDNQGLGPSSSRRGRPETIHASRKGLGKSHASGGLPSHLAMSGIIRLVYSALPCPPSTSSAMKRRLASAFFVANSL